MAGRNLPARVALLRKRFSAEELARVYGLRRTGLGGAIHAGREQPMRPGAIALAATMALAAGCGADLGGVFVMPTYTATPKSFTLLYNTVLRPSCSNNYCHYSGVGVRYSALDMSSRSYAYWSLVDQPAAGPGCSRMGMRVVPGDPDHSLLYLKVAPTMPPCGARMPANPTTLMTNGTSEFSGTPLPDDQQQLIADWIANGAKDD
jgi:hypothetical protein